VGSIPAGNEFGNHVSVG